MSHRDHPIQRRRNDHVHIRAKDVCQLCLADKHRGLLVCWTCFNAYDMANGNPLIEHRLADLERELELEQQEKDRS